MTKANTIASLMHHAEAAFAAGGYDGTSLRDVARRADVPLGAIYNYFKSKDELYYSVLIRALEEVNRKRIAHEKNIATPAS